MKRSTTRIALVCAALVMGAALSAADNVLKNPGFETNAKGIVLSWYMNGLQLKDYLVKDPGGNYIKMPSVEKKSVNGQKRFGNVLTQQVMKPKGGTYVYGVDLAPSQKFYQVLIILYYKGKDGKTVFSGTQLKPKDYPEPGKWTRLVGEITIPEGLTFIAFCVEIRAKEVGGDLLIKAPCMQLKEE